MPIGSSGSTRSRPQPATSHSCVAWPRPFHISISSWMATALPPWRHLPRQSPWKARPRALLEAQEAPLRPGITQRSIMPRKGRPGRGDLPALRDYISSSRRRGLLWAALGGGISLPFATTFLPRASHNEPIGYKLPACAANWARCLKDLTARSM